jgi:hypothetical protein
MLLRCVVFTFALVLQQAHPLSTAVGHFAGNACNKVLWDVPRCMWSIEVVAWYRTPQVYRKTVLTREWKPLGSKSERILTLLVSYINIHSRFDSPRGCLNARCLLLDQYSLRITFLSSQSYLVFPPKSSVPPFLNTLQIFPVLVLLFSTERAGLAQSVQCLTTDWTAGIWSLTEAEDFPLVSASRPALGPTQPTIQWVPGAFSPGVKRGRGVMLTTHPLLVPRLR